ncbi:MAG: cupin [Alphaproteobacteria bacterium PA4]|nr:MAG: cupin [Alphaproteobacteria bacterium PA4]
MDLAALLAPLPVDRFRTEFFGSRPCHVPAAPGMRAPLIGWDRLAELLAIAPHWTEGHITLVLNRAAIAGEFYMDECLTPAGPVRRADPAKVEHFLGLGATLVANDVDAIAPELRAITAMLGAEFAALSNANIYASFAGVQGFATHYDLHDVIAVQCAGEKRWNIYGHRAANPVAPLAQGGAEAQALIDAARGPLAGTVTMRPGDLLYLPRGVYHDALATDGPSLHVTFALAPHSGEGVLKLLGAAALRDPQLRAYLPDGRTDPAALDAHLADLAQRLAGIVTSPGFRDAVIDAQRSRHAHPHAVRLPRPPAAIAYARTDVQAEVRYAAEGAMLVTARGATPLGLAFAPADYALARAGFSDVELAARFPHVPQAEQHALLALLERERLVQRYTPELG